MPIIVAIAPTLEPLTAAEVQAFCHLPATEVVTSFIAAARQWVEDKTGRALMAQTRELVLDEWPRCHEIKIHCAPVRSIESIKYKDTAAVEATWDAAEYIADTDGVPARIVPAHGRTWPSAALLPVNAIRIRFPAGYSISTDNEATQQAAVPARIKETMLRRIRWQFDHRDVAQDQLDARGGLLAVPDVVEQALVNELADFRVWRF